MRKIPFALLFLFALQIARAQLPFSTRDSIAVNNINASVLVHGDMWWNPDRSPVYEACFYPTGTRKTLTFAGAIWLSGYDDAGQLHVAAQTYRNEGNDYWPGPLDAAGNTDYATSEKWARIWKVSRAEVNYYRSTFFHTFANVPASILHWPGKGNIFARGKDDAPITVDREMAPFVDKDGDGVYEPLSGDYPDFKGEQVLWWIVNDNGPTHSQTNGRPLKFEIRCMSYAFKRGTLIDDVVYYDYKIVNRSGTSYHDVRFALWNDESVGYYADDAIGFDSVHRMGIAYNAVNKDGVAAGSPTNSYGENPPVVGITLIDVPGDMASQYVPAGSFMQYYNDPSIIGVPTVDTEYNNYMRAKLRNGAHLRYDPDSPFVFTGPERNYVYPDDPSGPGKWHGCFAAGFGDKRFVLSSDDFNIASGRSEHVLLALLVDSAGGGCPAVSFSGIRRLADTAWAVHKKPPHPVAVQNYRTEPHSLHLVPNPASSLLRVSCTTCILSKYTVTIYDILGRTIDTKVLDARGGADLDVSYYSPGIYGLRCSGHDAAISATFVKN